MTTVEEKFYKGRVALNVLAGSIDNAVEVFEAAEGHVLVGVLSKNYATVTQAVSEMKAYGKSIHEAVSVGLGAGDNKQSKVVEEIAKHYAPNHINQVFPSVGATRTNANNSDSWINALVSPSGKPGYVVISTGVESSKQEDQAVVPVKSAIALVRDMGGNSLKYFNMQGLKYETEYQAVAKACGEEGFGLEPTGGIDFTNFERILEIALKANVPKVIPHVYSSIIDSETGNTRTSDVKELLKITKRLVDAG